MTGAELQQAFLARGWVRGAGGELYFNGMQTTGHPHLHMRIATLATGTLPRVGGDIRLGVCMLAYSDGGRGRTFISEAGDRVNLRWRQLAQECPMTPAVRDEFAWIIDYFTSG